MWQDCHKGRVTASSLETIILTDSKYLNFTSTATRKQEGKCLIPAAHRNHTGWPENNHSDTTLSQCDPGLHRKVHSLVFKSWTGEHCSATFCCQECTEPLCAFCLCTCARDQGEGSMREDGLEGIYLSPEWELTLCCFDVLLLC